MRPVLASLVFLLACHGDDSAARVAELQQEVTDLRAELRSMRQDLRDLRDERRVEHPAAGAATTEGAAPTAGTATPTTPTAPSPAAGSAAPTTPPSTVELRLQSQPTAAMVYLADKLMGKTPMVLSLPFAAKPVELRVEKPGYAASLLTVLPSADRDLVVKLRRVVRKTTTPTSNDALDLVE